MKKCLLCETFNTPELVGATKEWLESSCIYNSRIFYNKIAQLDQSRCYVVFSKVQRPGRALQNTLFFKFNMLHSWADLTCFGYVIAENLCLPSGRGILLDGAIYKLVNHTDENFPEDQLGKDYCYNFKIVWSDNSLCQGAQND